MSTTKDHIKLKYVIMLHTPDARPPSHPRQGQNQLTRGGSYCYKIIFIIPIYYRIAELALPTVIQVQKCRKY